MGTQRYSKEGYIIISTYDGWIVYNTKKEWEKGHTHLKSFKASVDLINFALVGKVPRDSKPYYLISLQRITDDQFLYDEIELLLKVRRQKGEKQTYRNVGGRKR